MPRRVLVAVAVKRLDASSQSPVAQRARRATSVTGSADRLEGPMNTMTVGGHDMMSAVFT